MGDDSWADQLSAFERVLAGTDGTVTTILAAYLGEAIGIELLGQDVATLSRPDDQLRAGAGHRVLTRRVVLHGRTSGVRLLYGQSQVVLARLSPGVRRDLFAGELPIGLILRHHRIETFRAPLDSGVRDADAGIASLLGPGPLCYRRYAIVASGKPIMVVHEEFPLGHLEERHRAGTVGPGRDTKVAAPA